MSKPKPTCDSTDLGMRCALPPKHRGGCQDHRNPAYAKHFWSNPRPASKRTKPRPTVAELERLTEERDEARKALTDLHTALAEARTARLLRTCDTVRCSRLATKGWLVHDSVLHACDECSALSGEFREHPHWTPVARRLIALLPTEG
ncbi:MAG: hypothetical protein EOO70_07915 [Myxococcaceae bacterium]|nr:MAG: hypothetical protein EOO70_07915 [Myxococcaceae bacterium]